MFDLDRLSIYTGVKGSVWRNNLLRVQPSGPLEVEFSLSPQFRLKIVRIPILDEPCFPLSPRSSDSQLAQGTFCGVPSRRPRSLPSTARSRIHIRSMFQPTKASALQTVVGVKAGNEGVKASPSASSPVGPIAIEGEGGFTYLHKMMAQRGLSGTGESEPRAFGTLLSSAYIPNP